LLVQVERTGKEHQDGSHIHALDVKEWLTTVGLDEAEIAIKTAETNDLNSPENLNLLSPMSQVRVIVTKSALQEGWDCPFAYVLCSLAASSNLSGMTQLVGRILRQPHAEKTGVAALDECYVITHHANTAGVVDAIKAGLEEDGLGDLVREIWTADPGEGGGAARPIARREKFRRTEIYLPLVLRVERGEARALDYQADILSAIDWRGTDPAELVAAIPDNAQAADSQMRRIRLADTGTERILSEENGRTVETLIFDPAHAVRMVSDVVPNPWVARDIVGALLCGLTARGFSTQKLGELSGLIVEELRRWLDARRAGRAETLFRAEVEAGRIQFRLRADGRNWSMPEATETLQQEGARQLAASAGGPLERSLFAPIYEADFSSQDERDIAVYLDGEAALRWWHRNVARQQYAVQGWRREKIYPDFIFALEHASGSSRVAILEMKGDQLAGNLDTNYKRDLLRLMSGNFSWDSTVPVGTLELVQRSGATVECELILMSEWKAKLPGYLKAEGAN
jgi:type III restriction enzyme